jgi:two-component system nitrate/nitrite response regulator NarL
MMRKVSAKQIIRVLVADDHPVVRKGLHSCLSKQERLRIVGEATTGEEAVERALALAPDVVLMDISMPRMNGLVATQTLRQEAPQIKVLILSVHNNREYIFRIIQAGAHGYVSKEASPEELLHAIESVYTGETFFSPEVAQAALHQLVQNGGKKEPFAQLTVREREVLVLIAEGQSNKEIASKLGIGVRTIETHRERIMRRLDIHSVAGLTKFAIANGLVPLEGDRQA